MLEKVRFTKSGLLIVMVMVSSAVVLCFAAEETGFAVGPAHIEVVVPANGSTATYIYITSYVDGELIVGTENLTFLVEPATVPITTTHRSRKVELTVHGNSSLAMGEYSGKLTLLLYTGNNVAHGVKLNATFTQEGAETGPSLLDQLLEVLTQNYVVIIAVIGILIALIIGVYIGKRSKKTSGA